MMSEISSTPKSTRLVLALTSSVLVLIFLIAVGYGVYRVVLGGKVSDLPFLKQAAFKCTDDANQYLVYISIKEALRDPNRVCKLDLSSQGLTKFPLEIIKLTNLRRLLIKGNRLTDTPVEIESMRSLEAIDLSDNQLPAIPSGILHMVWLRELSLSNNPIKSLPPGLFGLVNLTQLYLNGDSLNELPSGIGYLTKIEILYLNQTKIKVIPDEISNLKNLRSLYLKGNQLTDLDKQRLKKLLPNTQIYFE